jgi:hypothetical protein
MGVRGKKLETWQEAEIWRWWKRVGTIRGVARVTQLDRNTVRRVLRDVGRLGPSEPPEHKNPKNTR